MWYLVLSRPVVPRDQMLPHMEDHSRWMERQHRSGNVLFSGPTPDRRMGIYVVRAASTDEAQSIIQTDPLHANALREPEVIEWEAHQVLGAGTFGRSGPRQ